MLTEDQKTDARRHMGYPMYGDQPSQMFGYRFMTHYGTMEYRLLHLSASEEAVVVQMITDCNNLERATIDAGSNLDTNIAAVWERNPHEVGDRQRLYYMRRSQLCAFIGVPTGPGLQSGREIIV